MKQAGDVRRLLWLLRHYTAPYWWAVGLLLVTSYLATALAASFPVLMAPILDLALGTSREASTGTMSVTGHGLSLPNFFSRVRQTAQYGSEGIIYTI